MIGIITDYYVQHFPYFLKSYYRWFVPFKKLIFDDFPFSGLLTRVNSIQFWSTLFCFWWLWQLFVLTSAASSSVELIHFILVLVWKDQQLYEIQNYREPIPGKFYLIPALKYVMPLQSEVFWILSASLVVFVLIGPTRIRGTGSCFFFSNGKKASWKKISSKYHLQTIFKLFKLSSNTIRYSNVAVETQPLRVRLVQVPLDGP